MSLKPLKPLHTTGMPTMNRFLAALVCAIAMSAAHADAKYTLSIAVVTDWQTVQSFGGPAATQAALEARVAQASQIYTDAMGLQLVVASWTIPTSAETDFPYADTQYLTLLNDVVVWREASAAQCDQAITILMTTREMTDNKIGESNTGAACWAQAGSVVEVNFGSYWDAIVLAHEIGHNLDADHDGDATGSCAATAQNEYIMTAYPLEATAGTFSPCSIAVITAGFGTTHPCVQLIKTQSAAVAPAAAAAPATPAGKGGGGAFEWISILLLTVTLVTRLSCTKV